ncbi:MAG: glycosyltransferase [Polyangiales bacterium]
MRSQEETITVFSTFPGVDRIELPPNVEHVSHLGATYRDVAKAYLSNANEERCFLYNGLSRKVWLLSLLKMLRPNRKRRLVVADMILFVPTTLKERLAAMVRKQLLSKVDLFLSYARHTEGIRKIYGLPASRFRYVPFKVNDPEIIARTPSTDEGYIVVAGQTRRDFTTFRKAIEGLSMPVRIVAPHQEVLLKHGSALTDVGWPDHVVFVRDAIQAKDFIPQLARARVVVLPILEMNITPSGIGVCLVAMALRKCVVVSSGPVADGLLEDGQAIVVPAGDALALREAIVAAWTNDELRTATANRGFEYARSLGDEKRLHRDVFDTIATLYRSDAT